MTHADLTGWTISLDLWGTLIDHTDNDAVGHWREAEFVRVLAEFGYAFAPGKVRAAITATDQHVLNQQRHTGVQPVLGAMLTTILNPLGVPGTPEMMQVLGVVHTHAALRGCPQPLPGAVPVLNALADTEARLVLTSNTLATTPEVHRQLLEDLDLTRHFHDMLFSGDLGVAKPHPDVFAAVAARAGSSPGRICHVGDDLRTDVDGALAAGCVAVHYNPAGQTGRTGAPAITHLDQLIGTLTSICPTDAHTPVPERS